MSVTVYRIEPGRGVVCDICNKDFTDDPATGGIYGFGTKAIGPCCAKQMLDSAKEYGEEWAIKAHCPRGMSFADWVRNDLRGEPTP